MQNNNQVENGNASQGLIVRWFRGQDMTLQLLIGLFGIGPIILAIGLAITTLPKNKSTCSKNVGA